MRAARVRNASSHAARSAEFSLRITTTYALCAPASIAIEPLVCCLIVVRMHRGRLGRTGLGPDAIHMRRRKLDVVGRKWHIGIAVGAVC